ncbi:MAG: hypothetical protein HYR86_13275 [Candidatus Rokubacteria bacterium]|nr:hypothetical protein [Candidatus Rokubacteria bacterium]
MTVVTGRLGSEHIQYMLTGSMAGNYYAVPRMTRDIDIVVEVASADAGRVCALFESDFYVDRDAVAEAIASRGVFNIIHQAYLLKVDFIVRKDTEYRRVEFARRRRASVEGHAFSIVTAEDLIISKLDWARDSRSESQLADVRNLVASIPDLDRAYLEQWTERLGLGDAYREVIG